MLLPVISRISFLVKNLDIFLCVFMVFEGKCHLKFVNYKKEHFVTSSKKSIKMVLTLERNYEKNNNNNGGYCIFVECF